MDAAGKCGKGHEMDGLPGLLEEMIRKLKFGCSGCSTLGIEYGEYPGHLSETCEALYRYGCPLEESDRKFTL